MGLIGGAIGAAGGIFGGISASKALRQMKRNVEAQRKSNQDWYDQRYNEDATQRADAQRLLTMTEESIRKRNQQAAGSAAVMVELTRVLQLPRKQTERHSAIR